VVLALATRLRNDGIDAIIDQTHLLLGARSPEFMERSVREWGFVLVICTEKYKQRFDDRQGGAGYEGHIITGEIFQEVGRNKFIPVVRSGDWKSAVPTALSGVHGIDLRSDSGGEYQKLVKHLHGRSDIPPVGEQPPWLGDSASPPSALPTASKTPPDPQEYWAQRNRLPNTTIIEKIWSTKPRWRIWIRASEFKRARFQNLEHCREFMRASGMRIVG
jgi:hypothetical protein